MTPKERDFVAAQCAARAGLDVESVGAAVMERRLAVVARREGYASISDLVRAVRDRGEEPLAQAVVEAMGPAGGGFFRDPEVFETLAVELQARAAAGRPVRVWSAACGAGQEIHSLAMLLEERGVEGVALFGSDLNSRLVATAQAGLYSPLEVQQGLSARRLVRHFENADDGFRLAAEVRRRVRWRPINLMEPPVGVGAFDVILFRYALPAFLESAQARILAHLAQALGPGGRLVLGRGERAPGLAAIAGAPCAFEAPARVGQAA
jgi:chemotaxis protein methyltransferase CheR